MQNGDNLQLQRKFDKKKSFYNDMEKISRKYLQFQQQVYYSPIKDINPDMIITLEEATQISNTKPRRRELLYIINGQYQPHGNRSFQKLILQIVQTIPRPKNPFGIIYINTLAHSDAYDDFKKVLQLLPFEYLFNLTKIYILQATFFNKASSWLSFGVTISYINNKTIHVQNVRQLSQQSHVSLEVLKAKLPKNTVSFLFKQSDHRSENKPVGILRVQQVQNNDKKKKLDEITEHFVPMGFDRSKSDNIEIKQKPLTSTTYKLPTQNKFSKQMSEYQLGPTGAPIVLELLIYFFSNKEEHLKHEGLFRKSVSIDEQTQILHQLNIKNYNYLQKVTDPHLIANAIKRFLSNCKTPVIPYQMFEKFMLQTDNPKINIIVVQSIKSLPKISRMVLFMLFDFLKNSVLPYAEYNKMGMNNLCIVFGPCLMRSQISSIKDLIYAKKIIVVTSLIFTQFQQIYGDKNAQAKLKRSSYKEYRISQNNLRQSKSSKQSNEQGTKIEDSPSTPTFKEAALLHKTSEFIKEALLQNQSDCQQLDNIEKQQPIHGIQTHREGLGTPTFQINMAFKQAENKQKITNLFITPSIQRQEPTNSNKSLKIETNAAERIRKPSKQL